MGTSFSGLNFEHKITKKDFTLIRKFRDPRFGEVSEMKNKKTGKLVLMKEREIRHIPKYKDLLRKFTYRSSLSHANLVPIYGFTGMDATDIFNQNSKVYVYFEYLQNDLLQTIRNRKRPIFSNQKPSEKGSKLQPFEEAELFGLMVQLVDVLEFLQRNKVYHGDIRPETCFISNEGIVKLVDRWCVSDEETLSDEDARQGNRRTFVTPAILRDIGNGIQRGRGDYKDDVFSLGMTLLECATLQSSNKMYDWNLHEIDLEQLTDRLFEVKEQYSPRLMQFLAEMLQFDDGKRPDFIELKMFLNGENQIGGGLTSRPSMHTSIEENVVQDGGIQSMNPKTMQALIKGSSSATKTGKPGAGAGKNTQRKFNNKPKKLAKNSKYVVKVDVNEEEIVQNTREGTMESLAGSKSNFDYNYDNKLGYDSNPQHHFPSDYFKNQGKLRSLNEVLQEAIFRQAQQQASLNDLNSLQDPKSIRLENLSSLRNAEPKDQAHTQAASNPSSHINNPQSIPSIHNIPSHNYSKAVPLPKQASFGDVQPNNPPNNSFLQNPDLKIHSKYLNLPKLDETFNENSSLSIHQTPLNSGVSSRTPLYYRSGYMNPFVDRYNTPQANKNPASFKKALENHSINVPRSSNASFIEIPKKTVNLSYQSANFSYGSPQNFKVHNENKKFTDLSTTEIAASNKLLVDTILEKVLNASGMKNGPSGRKSRGSHALNSVSSTTKLAQSQIIYDHPNQRNSSNMDNKEPLRAQYLNNRTSHSTGGPINFNLYGSSLMKKENEVECKTIYLDYSPPPKERTSEINANGGYEQNFVESPSPQKKELLSSRLKDDIKSLMDETRQILYSTKNSLGKNPKLTNHKKSSSVLYGGNLTNLDNSLVINLNSSLKMEPGYISNESSRRRQSFYLQN